MSRWPLILLVIMLGIHRGGWWEGGVYIDEDIAGHFYLMKSRLYLLSRGLEPWSWWDPLTLLGSPRLSNIQVGWLSPVNLWFVALPPVWAWRLYPLCLDGLLLWACYWVVREFGGSRAVAAWAALAWVVTGSVLYETQHPCYKESLLTSLLWLACLQRWWRWRQPRYLAGLAMCGYLHVAAGSPSALFFDHCSVALLLPWVYLQTRPPWPAVLRAMLAYAGGALLAAPALLPMQDYHSHGHRSMAEVAGAALSESYRLTPMELVMRLASESHVGSPTMLKFGMGYPLQVDFSLALLLLAGSALAIARLRPLLVLSSLVVLQSMGERGGLLWLLHKVAPATLQIRGPERFFFLGSWGLVLTAALAWQHWRQYSRPTRLLSDGLAGWAVCFALLAQSSALTSRYLNPAVLQPPPMPRRPAGRVSVLRYSSPQPPLLWEVAAVLQGMPTLLMPEVILERGYLSGLAYSQWGAAAVDKLGPLVRGARNVPVTKPEAPLLLSWGLTWVLEGQGDQFAWRRLQADPPRHWWSRPARESAPEWASRTEGDPFSSACVEGPTEVPDGQGGRLQVEWESADYQRLRVEGAGLLISADQWDPGWRCWHDGLPVPVVRANLALKACWVKAGVRVVEWRYQPPWWPKFWIFHGTGWLLLVLVWLGFRRRPEQE